MPLVIPEINEAESEAMMAQLAVIISKTDEWTSKLVGKKLGDFHDETTFAKTDLPSNTRIIQHGETVSQDHDSSRLNVHLSASGQVQKVGHY